MSKKNKHYEDKFKEQIVMLYKSGKNLREISRSKVYYNAKPKIVDEKLENIVIQEFNKNRKCFGTRKLKVKLLENHKFVVSRRKISKIMKKYNLISK